MSRIAIYLIYDKDEIIDEYVGYLLKDLCTCVEKLVVVINGQMIAQGDEYLTCATEVFFRENKGYDAGGFKDAIEHFIGWEELKKYDELVLANDSFYGPFKSFKSIFRDMENKACDFWAASKHAESIYQGQTIHEHLQSFFIVIRGRMLHSEEFRNYWKAMPQFSSFKSVVTEHEMVFTRYFMKKGYTYSCLADMNSNDSRTNLMVNYCQYGFLQYELISKRNFPFLKKKPVSFNTLDMQTQENWKLAIDYIKECTNYNINLIYNNMIRLFDASDLQKKFQLQYIIKEYTNDVECMENVCIIVCVENESSIPNVFEYTDKLTKCVNMVFITHNKSIDNFIQENNYNCILCSEECVEMYLYDILKYEYICIINDCDMSGSNRYSTIEKSYFYNVWSNMINSKSYVADVITKMKINEHIGVLTHPIPVHGDYFGKYLRYWTENYNSISNVIKEKNIKCVISKDKMPVVVTNNVWIRGEILRKAVSLHLLSERGMEYMWSYLAQSMGLYSGIIESETYASMNQINQQIYLAEMIKQTIRQNGNADTFDNMQKSVTYAKISSFCSKYKYIYIYGTGIVARQYRTLIEHIDGYVVSDGQPKGDNADVLYLSQIEAAENLGIIVCLNEKNQNQVIPLLQERNFNYLCV